MSTFYASFSSTASVERVIAHLMSQGVGPDDISVLSHEPLLADVPAAAPSTNGASHLTDATAFVGREDDPDPLAEPRHGRDLAKNNYSVESPIGTGIRSDTTERTVDSVDQMQDAQSAAEDMTYPPELISQGDHEDDDMVRTLDKGFPSAPPVIDDFEQPAISDVNDLTQSLDAIPIPDFGVVVGGGALATAALDLGNEDGNRDPQPLIQHLLDQGMTKGEANEFIESFKSGKTLLAVALVPGEIEAPYVEQLAENHGAENAVTCDAPRY